MIALRASVQFEIQAHSSSDSSTLAPTVPRALCSDTDLTARVQAGQVCSGQPHERATAAGREQRRKQSGYSPACAESAGAFCHRSKEDVETSGRNPPTVQAIAAPAIPSRRLA